MVSHQFDRLWKQLIVLFLDESMKAFTGRITYTGKTFVQSKLHFLQIQGRGCCFPDGLCTLLVNTCNFCCPIIIYPDIRT